MMARRSSKINIKGIIPWISFKKSGYTIFQTFDTMFESDLYLSRSVVRQLVDLLDILN